MLWYMYYAIWYVDDSLWYPCDVMISVWRGMMRYDICMTYSMLFNTIRLPVILPFSGCVKLCNIKVTLFNQLFLLTDMNECYDLLSEIVTSLEHYINQLAFTVQYEGGSHNVGYNSSTLTGTAVCEPGFVPVWQYCGKLYSLFTWSEGRAEREARLMSTITRLISFIYIFSYHVWVLKPLLNVGNNR